MTQYVYFDVESFPIQPAIQVPPIVCASYAIDDGAPELLHARDPKFRELVAWIMSSDAVMVAHNFAYEVLTLLAKYPEHAGDAARKLDAYQFRCTMVREKSLRIARGDFRKGFALDACLEAWGSPIKLNKNDPWRLRYGTLWDVPVAEWPQGAKDYALGDIAVRDLYKAQEASRHLLVERDQILQHWAAVGLACASATGAYVDPDTVPVLISQTEARLEAHKQELLQAGLLRYESSQGVTTIVKCAKVAAVRVEAAYAAQGREPPRNNLTPAALNKAYRLAELPSPGYTKRDKINARHIEKALEEGVPDDLLQGSVSCDEEACEGAQDPLLEAYTEYGQAGTLLAKLKRLKRAADTGCPIQAHYNVLVATGRASCSNGDDPKPGEAYSAYGFQMHNLPRSGEEGALGVREQFVAPAGDVDISVDFDTAELRSVAQVCIWELGYSELANILNNPLRDPHIELGTRIRGKFDPSGSDWRAQYAYGYDMRARKDPALKKLRNLAKGPGFGLWGGMGPERLIDYCWGGYREKLTPDQAKDIKRVWGEMLPETQPYFNMIKEKLGIARFSSRGEEKQKGTLVQWVTGRIRGQVGFCDGANGGFQSLTADYKKAALRALWIESYVNKSSVLYGLRTWNEVHDELLARTPRERLAEVGPEMARVIVAAAQPYCPDVRLSASPAAFYRWSKAAGDPEHDDAGNLIAYEEKRGYKGPPPPKWNLATWEKWRLK